MEVPKKLKFLKIQFSKYLATKSNPTSIYIFILYFSITDNEFKRNERNDEATQQITISFFNQNYLYYYSTYLSDYHEKKDDDFFVLHNFVGISSLTNFCIVC